MQSIVATKQKQTSDTGISNGNSTSALPYAHADFCERFLSFLTSPGAHPDTYIGGALRHFFKL